MENSTKGLEDEFHHAMIGVADFANAHNFGYRFRQMLGEYGGVETAKRLLATSKAQSGLAEMYLNHAIRMSMEAYVIEEHFRSLFCEDQIEEARYRLEELGYFNKI